MSIEDLGNYIDYTATNAKSIPLKHTTQLELIIRQVDQIFDNFDKQGNGVLTTADAQELTAQLMDNLGIQANREQL